MPVKTGQAVVAEFTTAHPTTGAAADASSLPTGTLYVNGTANAATVTVTNQATGVYKAAVTLPTLAAGNLVAIRISATVATIAGEGIVWQDTADTIFVSDVSAVVVAGTPSQIYAGANSLDRGTARQAASPWATGGVASTYADTLATDTAWLACSPLNSTATINGIAGVSMWQSVTFLCGTARANYVSVVGYHSGGSGTRVVDAYYYDYVSTTWKLLTSPANRMNNASADATYGPWYLPAAAQKNQTAGDGEVKIAFVSSGTTTGDILHLNLVFLSASVAGPSANDVANAVYAKMLPLEVEGIWLDTVNGSDANDGYTNATPILTIAQAYVRCSAANVKRVYFTAGSNATAVVLTQSALGWRFVGPGKIDLGGQSIADAIFDECYSVYGLSTGDDATFLGGGLGSGGITLDHHYLKGCRLKGAITLIANADPIIFQNCIDATGAAANFELIFVATATAIIRNFQGAVTLKNMVSGNTIVIDGACRVTIDASCTGGSITLRGFADLPTGATGNTFGTSGTITQTARYAVDQINAQVDEALNTAIPGSPTADSINERVARIDDLLPVSWTVPGTGTSTLTAQQVWEYATRTLSAFSFTVTANVTTIEGTDATDAIQAAAAAVIADEHLARGEWFVAKTGNDANDGRSWSTAKLTLGATKTAASAPAVIRVGAGSYNERNLAKNGIDWDFLPGASVDYTGTAGAIFDDAGAAVNYAVRGDGKFAHTGASGNRHVLRQANASSRVFFEADDIQSPDIATYVAGKVSLRANNIAGASNIIDVAGGSLVVVADFGTGLAHADVGYVNYAIGISTNAQPAIAISNGTGAWLVRDSVLRSSDVNAHTIETDGSEPTIAIVGCSIKSTTYDLTGNGDASNIGVYSSYVQTAKLHQAPGLLTSLSTVGTDSTLIQAAAAAAITANKTGYSLAATGLDAIADPDDLTPATVPTTFSQKLRWLIQRFWKAEKTATTIVVKNEAGQTITTQAITPSGSDQTTGAPS
jgi:hypothetical protein